MFENYTVSVKLSLINQVSPALALLARQFASTNREAAALQRKMNDIKTLASTGVKLFGGAAALAAPFIYATDKAAELQKQMIAIQLASRGTAREMDAMRSVIEKTAAVTIFSNVDVAKMGKLIATGTGLGASQVSGILPEYAKFADVQSLMKGTSYTESVTNAIRLAHTAGHYDEKSLAKYLDLLTKASMIVPGGLGEVGHALKYSQGMAKTALGIDDEQMVLLTALANRLGLSGSRGGTNMIAAMGRTIPGVFGSGLLTGKSNEALRAMGMIDASGHSKAFKNGKFDAFAWIGLLGQFVQREFASKPEAIARQDIYKDFSHAFGVQGSRVASLFSSPQAIEQLRMIGGSFDQMGGVDAMQKRFADDSVAQQYTVAKTNFVSAMTEMGYTLLPVATKVLKAVNVQLGKLIDWITNNQEKAKQLAYAFLGLAGAMAFAGTLAILTSSFRALAIAASLLSSKNLAAAASGIDTLAGKIGLLAGVAVASYGAGTWIADKVNEAIAKHSGHKDETLGGALFDYANRDNMELGATSVTTGMAARRAALAHEKSRSSAYAQGKAPGDVTISIPLIVDGKKLASAVTKYQVDAFGMPQTGLGSFDGTMSLAPIGGGG